MISWFEVYLYIRREAFYTRLLFRYYLTAPVKLYARFRTQYCGRIYMITAAGVPANYTEVETAYKNLQNYWSYLRIHRYSSYDFSRTGDVSQ